jgi:Recombination endonuclease VII
MHKCPRCLIEKPIDQFLKRSGRSSGVSHCKECERKRKLQYSRDYRKSGPKLEAKLAYPIGFKKCNKCEEVKRFDDFFKDKNNKTDGHYSVCKPCKLARTESWRTENKDKYNATMRAYNKRHYRKLHLSRYELTVEQYEAMIWEQGGKCKICQADPKGARPLVVDHCHNSKRVRGLLCYGCNRAISILDKPELLKKAIAYLKS